jgi:hypothetical protein
VTPPSPLALALAPVRSLGLVLVGCPDCRAVVGIDGAAGLPDALAAHRRVCPAADDVCPGCGCEAELYPRGDGWRCGDCLGERLFDTLASPPTLVRSLVRIVRARPRRAKHQGATDPESAEKAVA